MAARFWVGSGTWDATNTGNWAATSGGATGVSVPSAADTVTFDSNSGSCSVTTSIGTVACSTLTLAATFTGTIASAGGTQYAYIDVAGTSAVLTPGACSIAYVYFNLRSASAATTLNANFSNAASLVGANVAIGYGVTSTATFTLTTNGNFYKDVSNYVNIEVWSGTLSSGTVNMTGNTLNLYNGTYNAVATTVTLNDSLLVFPSAGQTTVLALGTSTINASNLIQIGSSTYTGTTSVTVGATQTLSSTGIYIYLNSGTAQTLRTITAQTHLNIEPGSGTNVTAGAVTCNGLGVISAQSGYTTLPNVTLTSYTGNGAIPVNLTINDPGFTCGAISLTSSFTPPIYLETSKGAVNVTGTITLVDSNLTGTPSIYINSQAAFSGTPTVAYSALNSSVRGAVLFGNARNVTTGAITAFSVQDGGSMLGNVTTGAITIGGTLSAVVYDAGSVSINSYAAATTVTIASIAQGTGATQTTVHFQGACNLSITSTVSCAYFRAYNTGTVSIGNTLTVVNNVYNGVISVEFTRCSSITCAAITVTGTYSERTSSTYAVAFGGSNIGVGNPSVGAITMSGTLAVGSAGNRSAVNIDSTGAVNFSSTTATHLMGKLLVYNAASLVFGAGSTLTLNNPTTTADNPIDVFATTATTITFRTVTCDYNNPNTGRIYLNTPVAAVTFGTLTAGAATQRVGFEVTAASLTCAATEVAFYSVTTTGALTQSGALSISHVAPAVTNPVIAVDVGGTSSIASTSLASISTPGSLYVISLLGAGALTISGTLAGSPAVSSQLIINRAGSTTFSGAISAIDEFLHTAGNITFTGALAVGLRERMVLKSGFTVTPNTSVITIAGTSPLAGVAVLDHGGYTLNSVIFPATASQQVIFNSSNATGLTLASLSSTGAAVTNSYLQLGTNVTVTGSQLTISPNSTTNRHLVCSSIFGTARTLTAATRTINTGVDFQDVTAAGGVVPWNLFAISAGNAGGNTNITFPTAVTRFLVLTGTVNWDSTTAWSTSSGGATGASVPLAHDIVNLSGSSAIVYTNGRQYLGSSPVFGAFSGQFYISTLTNAIFIGSVDLSSVTGAISATLGGSSIQFLGRSAITYSPPSPSITFGLYLGLASTGSLSIGGPNDVVAEFISGNPFTTNTGTRIANITGSNSLSIGTAFSYNINNNAFGFGPLGTNNLNSSTVSAPNVYLSNCTGTTTQITASNSEISLDGTINFTNAEIGALNVNFAPTSNSTLGTSLISSQVTNFNGVLNSSAATFISRSDFIIAGSATWAEGTTQIIGRPISSTSFNLGIFSTSTINKVVLDDSLMPSGTTPFTSPVFFYPTNSSTSSTIRNFDSSLMQRPLWIGTSQFYVGGGIGTTFSNKAWTFFNSTDIRVSSSEPLYVPYAFCRNITVSAGSVVAYGPANLGGNTGSITYPSRLRYYAFVGTGATTMTVPNDYNGMGLFLAIGGGATASSLSSSATSGGGGGGTSYSFAFPLNNTIQPLTIGQTIWINAGSYPTSPVAGGSGSAGNSSWVNVLSNATPTLGSQGAAATGGAANGTAGTSSVSYVGFNGGSGGLGLSFCGGGGGGSSLFDGGIPGPGTVVTGGGGGGTTSAGTAAGQGGNGSVTGGAVGTTGAPGTAGGAGSSSTGSGGGGGGGNNASYATLTTTTSITRSSGVSTMTCTTGSVHGLTTGDYIYLTAVTLLKTGTWSKTSSAIGASVTVNITSHGLVAGNQFYFSRTSGGIVSSGTYTVATATTNSFTFVPNVVGTSSGNCTLGQSGLVNNTYYTVSVTSTTQFVITGSVSTVLASGQLSIQYQRLPVSASNNASNGGIGSLNGAQQFIRYYNGTYTPGYFGVGAGGGGGGAVVLPSDNRAGQAGSGGAGGIGAGGGGKGFPGFAITSGTIASTALGGRGGPGMVMFVYALRANNQSSFQGL